MPTKTELKTALLKASGHYEEMGRLGGNTNKESGHISKLGKENGAINGKSEKSRAKAKILGDTIGKANFAKTTFEHRSKGGKTSGRNRVLDGTLLRASKIGAKVSSENRIALKIEKYKAIIKFIRKKEFTYSDMRNACEKYGILDNLLCGTAKKILREKSLITQIHKGYNQFNPSLYVKIK
jgi:hypothetical protein